MVFVTLIRSIEDNERSVVMADSIRFFGGEVRNTPIWLFTPQIKDAPRRKLEELGVEIFELTEKDPTPGYLFGSQVYVCAKAEEKARGEFNSLVWIDTSCLVVRQPEKYDLGDEVDTAFRPVHIRNIGSLASERPDGYWQRIFETVGIEDVTSTVTSFVDNQVIRSYFNTHSFAVNPDKGLMTRWLELFWKITTDKAFQERYCGDDLHRIFLFQALLSTLLVTRLDADRIRILPPDYNYPYNLHMKVPDEKKARTLNELTTFTYEGRSIDPRNIEDIQITKPLENWLIERT